MNREQGVHGIGWMGGSVCNSGQAIGGVVRGSTQMQRGRQKVERMPRSEQECQSEQKWMGAQKQSGNLCGRRKLLGEWTGEWMYQTDVEGWEEG